MIDDMDGIKDRTAVGAADGDDHYTTLRTIHRERVAAMREFDRAEALAVRRARTAGASWRVIAMALEVSKQAVHKKYGRA